MRETHRCLTCGWTTSGDSLEDGLVMMNYGSNIVDSALMETSLDDEGM